MLHEHLEEFNEPLYFNQFAQRAAAKDLQYLGEASISLMMPSQFGPQAEQLLREISPDLLHMEQYMDFLRNRMFRQTLLTHAAVKLDHALRPGVLESMYVATSATPTNPATPNFSSTDPQQFTTPAKKILSTQDPLMKSAMALLNESWPVPIRFDTLLAAAREKSRLPASADNAKNLATRLLNCYCLPAWSSPTQPPSKPPKNSHQNPGNAAQRSPGRHRAAPFRYTIHVPDSPRPDSRANTPAQLIAGHNRVAVRTAQHAAILRIIQRRRASRAFQSFEHKRVLRAAVLCNTTPCHANARRNRTLQSKKRSPKSENRFMPSCLRVSIHRADYRRRRRITASIPNPTNPTHGSGLKTISPAIVPPGIGMNVSMNAPVWLLKRSMPSPNVLLT